MHDGRLDEGFVEGLADDRTSPWRDRRTIGQQTLASLPANAVGIDEAECLSSVQYPVASQPSGCSTSRPSN
jgi:hypothetical protein